MGLCIFQEPMPLLRASSRCFAPCDTVTKLARKVKQLSDQLQTMHTVVKKIMENPTFSDDGKFLCHSLENSIT